MNTTIQEIDGNMVAILEGRLDTNVAPATEEALSPLYECENQDIIVDCTKLEYISSSGLRILLALLKSARPKGCHVYISRLSDDLQQIFSITGFTNLFEFK